MEETIHLLDLSAEFYCGEIATPGNFSVILDNTNCIPCAESLTKRANRHLEHLREIYND